MSHIVGNQHAQNILSLLFDRLQTQDYVEFPFWLLAGPSHVGKTTLIEEFLKVHLGNHITQDYLPVYDCSEAINKQHQIRIDVPQKDKRIEIEDGSFVVDVGAREVIHWLSYAPVGKLKVVFLENIERMTISAVNALLKTFEEPLPNRLIVASTGSQDMLLDTVISRACSIQFSALSMKDSEHFVTTHFDDFSEQIQSFLVGFSLGKPGLMYTLAHRRDIEEMASLFRAIQSASSGTSPGVVSMYNLLLERKKTYSLSQLLDALLYVSTSQTSHIQTSLITAKKRLTTNVSVDTVLFDLSLNLK